MSENQSVCEQKVYQKLYETYSKALYNFAYYKCGSAYEAEDLVQDAFIKMWNNCSKVLFDKAKSYLFTIANNAFLNDVAHQKVKLKYQKEHIKEGSSVESPDFKLEEEEFMQKLDKAIADLTPGQREVFLLNRIEDKKYREIAEMLGISVKAVEKRMHGALLKLKNSIGKKL